MLTAPRRRAAFTLVEMLVVISIIAVLVGLTATAVLGVRISMQTEFSKSTLVKIDQKLHQKQVVMTNQIRDDLEKRQDAADVQAVLTATGGNVDQARAILLYARMRRDLPMTFAEAKSPFTVCGHTYQPSPAFAALPAAPPSGMDGYQESAACLYAAIAGTGLDGLEQQVGKTVGDHSVFIDAFGTPIAFVRQGYDGNQNELNKLTFDPFFPVKNNQSGGYQSLAAVYPAGAAAFDFQVWDRVRPNAVWLRAPQAPGGTGNWTDYPGAKNHTMFVLSAGVNRQFAEPTIYDGDNLFSYRLRKEGN